MQMLNQLICAASDPIDFGGSFSPIKENTYTTGVTTGSQVLQTLEKIISNVIGILTILATLFFIFQFVIAAITWVTAGEASNVAKSRQKMVNAFIGLIIVVASYAIIGVIGTIVGIDILNPATELGKLIPAAGP